MRDPNGPWRHGSVYLYVWNLTSGTILFHAGFPDTYELQPLVPVKPVTPRPESSFCRT